MSKVNPFGREEKTPSAEEILCGNFGIGFQNFDFGASVWDPNHTDKRGNISPAWVHVPRESMECVIQFSVNTGKGTGRQVIPASEFPQYVDSLQNIIDSGYAANATDDRSQYVPTYEHVSESFRMVRPKRKVLQSNGSYKYETDRNAEPSVVSVRCTGGKGAKPMLINRDEFPTVVNLLRKVSDNLDEYVELARQNYTSDTE